MSLVTHLCVTVASLTLLLLWVFGIREYISLIEFDFFPSFFLGSTF